MLSGGDVEDVGPWCSLLLRLLPTFKCLLMLLGFKIH